MELAVIKNGTAMFDALHALGLAVTIATATSQTVRLVDTGNHYRLTGTTQNLPVDLPLADLLPLPSAVELQALTNLPQPTSLPLTILDGLLAALFTMPGPRSVSLTHLIFQKSKRPEIIARVLKKVATTRIRWERYLARCSREADSWLAASLADYRPDRPVQPVTRSKRDHDLSVWMTLDPVFGLTTCRPFSDGQIANKINLAIAGTRYAAFLAVVGASRFLRAQRVAARLVNFYIPIPLDVTLSACATLPLLRGRDLPSDEAALAHWLSLPPLPGKWAGLGYQTLQTQGASQSISIRRGQLDWQWLVKLAEQTSERSLRYWRQLFLTPSRDRPLEINSLLAVFTSRSSLAWQAHLLETTWRQFNAAGNLHFYTLNDVEEVASQMNNSDISPLQQILQYDTGTIRFGHALRQLGQINHGALRDTLDDLNTVQTTDDLLHILGEAMQACIVASAKSKFIIIPDDNDVAQLMADMESYTPRTVARLLALLSALRYPRMNGLPKPHRKYSHESRSRHTRRRYDRSIRPPRSIRR